MSKVLEENRKSCQSLAAVHTHTHTHTHTHNITLYRPNYVKIVGSFLLWKNTIEKLE